MRKNLGAKPFIYPQPVLIIGTYHEDGTANAMNAAWGCISDHNQVTLYLSATHKTLKNMLRNKSFTVSMADVDHVIEADYVGVVSGNQEADKLAIANLSTIPSEFVNAPIIEAFPLTLECKLVSFDETSECVIGEIMNVSVEESILDEQGKIVLERLNPIGFDAMNQTYYAFGKTVGKAFHDGLQLKKR